NADAVYGNGDTITVIFNQATNRPGGSFLTRNDLLTLFDFSQSLGADFSGAWTDASTLVITVVDASGATPPQIGVLVITAISNLLKNQAGTSLPSTSTSPPIVGNWGLLPGPSIVSIVASDPDDGDA